MKKKITSTEIMNDFIFCLLIVFSIFVLFHRIVVLEQKQKENERKFEYIEHKADLDYSEPLIKNVKVR